MKDLVKSVFDRMRICHRSGHERERTGVAIQIIDLGNSYKVGVDTLTCDKKRRDRTEITK